MAHVSNVLGVVHPVEEMIALAKKVGAITVVDGAQAIPHMRVDLKALDCDFYCFSGHKALGPTGIGVLYGKSRWLEAMLPYQGGGGMICMVTVQGSTWAPAPEKFEAGTPNIEGAIGLGAAIAYLSELPLKELAVHQRQLGEMVYERLRAMKGVRLFAAPGPDWTGIVSFYHQAIHPHDLAAVADSVGVCIRAGHHCAQPLMRVLGVGSTARVSPYIYNTPNDIALFGEAMTKAEAIFG
jgi:selenocysteine lyase/cysteine desulfurase